MFKKRSLTVAAQNGPQCAGGEAAGRSGAARLHEDLGIDSLEDLEAAAHDGRLADVAGLGAKRVAGIVDSLATRLGRLRVPGVQLLEEAPVAELLDVDREYRKRAAEGELHKIAPRRFNPEREAWLPILHTHRGAALHCAIFQYGEGSQTGQTLDWVILYYDSPSGERRCTVITSRAGPLKDRRIVRGREQECAELHAVELTPIAREA